jgi:hypothetical protein
LSLQRVSASEAIDQRREQIPEVQETPQPRFILKILRIWYLKQAPVYPFGEGR